MPFGSIQVPRLVKNSVTMVELADTFRFGGHPLMIMRFLSTFY